MLEHVPWPWLIAAGALYLAASTAVGIACGELLARWLTPWEDDSCT